MKLVALIMTMTVLFFTSGTSLVKATTLDAPTLDCREIQMTNTPVTQRTYYEYVIPAMPLPLAIDKNQKALSVPLQFGVGSTPINFGQTLSASIDMAAEMDTYTFSANANDAVLIRMTKTSGSLWPGIRLFAPNGTELDEHCSTPTAEISYVLPSSGTYTILAYDCFNGSNTGSYNIYLQRLNAPGNPTPINFGQTLPASIDMAAEMDTYTFSANTNDTVLIRMTRTSGSLWPGIRLFAPDGTKLDEHCSTPTVEISYVLPSSGTYTILAYDCFNGSGTGTYNIYLQRLNAPGNATPISSGQTLSASIDMAAEMDTYTFSANTNDTVFIRMTTTSGSLWPGIRLFAPYGTELDQQCSTPTVEISYMLPSSGTYTILAYDCFNGSNTGDYNIYLGIITFGVCGDVAPYPDCNGIVDMGDVVLLLNYVGHPGEYQLCCGWCGDVAPCPASDGIINMGDVVLLLNYVGYPGEYDLCCG